MLLIEFLIILGSTISNFIIFLFALRLTRKTPIVEIKLLAISMFLFILSSILFIPLIWFSSAGSGVDPLGAQIYRLSFIPMAVGTLFFQLVFFLPTYKPGYRHISYLIILTFLDFGLLFSALYGETSWIVQGEYLREQTEPMIEILFLLSIAAALLLMFNRVREIRQLLSDQSFFLFSPRYLIVLAILTISTILIQIIIDMAPELPVPWAINDITTPLFLLVFVYGLKQNHHVFFLVPIKLHAIIVTEQKSGLVLYAESFNPEAPAEELLGMLMTSLNLSLKDTIQSQHDMEEISFGDKVVHLAPGQYVTTLFIADEKTMMTQTISRYLTKAFEQQFHPILSTFGTQGVNSSDYKDFKPKIDMVKPYFAF